MENRIGQNIRVFRLKAELTQRKLAEKSGIKEARLTRYETNRSTPSTGEVITIAKILGVDPARIDPSLFGSGLTTCREQR